MPTKKTWLSGMLESIQEDDPKKPKAATPPPPVPPPAIPSMPYASVAAAPATYPATAAPQPADPEAVNTLKKSVYVNDVAGHASTFMLYLRMWETLGHPADPNIVLNALKVMSPGLTLAHVTGDLTSHLALLENAISVASAEFDSAARATVGKNDDEITRLTSDNTNAQKEIERLQALITQNSTRLTQLQTERADNDGKINRARERVKTAADAVRGELVAVQQALTR